jgi:flagellar hook assembly protein FlgD
MTPVAAPIGLDATGTHTIAYRATDRAGNVEPTRTLKVVIDRTAPALGSVKVAGPFSPNGDDTRESASIAYAVSEPGSLTAVVKDPGGTTVRAFSANVGLSGTIGWDGRSESGSVVADGAYTLTLTPRDRAGNAGPAMSVPVHVFGAFVGGEVSPALFYPQDGDAQAKAAILRATLRTAAKVRLQVLDAKGVVIRTITRDLDAGTFAFGWDGRTDGGRWAPQGRYTLRYTAGTGSLVETKRFAVVARAFDIRPSLTTARRGRALTVTVVSAEGLHTTPRLVIRQPGISAYKVTLRLVAPRTWRATFTVRASRTGTMTISVDAKDSSGNGQQTRVAVPIR